MDEGLMLYFDHSLNTYTTLQNDELASIHQSSLIN